MPVTDATLFHIASATKTITTVGVLKFVDAGRLKLDDAIGGHLEGLPEKWQKITIRQMLTHTSGLPDYYAKQTLEQTGAPIAETPEKVMNLLRDRPVDFEAGSQYRYNQTNYLLLGLLIQKLSGISYAQFCKTQLFDPLKIGHAEFGDTRIVIRNRATIYTPFDFTTVETPQLMDHLDVLNFKSPPMSYPTNGLNITVSDFARWLVALMSGSVISKSSMDALSTPTRLTDGSFAPNEGLGWILFPDAQNPAIGGIGGPYAAFVMYPRAGLAIVVFTNNQLAQPESIAQDIAKKYIH